MHRAALAPAGDAIAAWEALKTPSMNLSDHHIGWCISLTENHDPLIMLLNFNRFAPQTQIS
jgi:hypothetical protein